MPWQLKQQPHELKEKRPLRPLEMGQGRQYALEESHELSSCTGQLGNVTLEDDGSCGHRSLNKIARSIVVIKASKHQEKLCWTESAAS